MMGFSIASGIPITPDAHRSWMIIEKQVPRLARLLLLLMALPALADEEEAYRAASPPHRVALLELYTSEGCSSCPPTDRFLSALKDSVIDNRQVVPLAFHVTYWDYIGWQDRFADAAFDQRQRRQASLNASRRVYTPQLLLNGNDYRGYRTFANDVRTVNSQEAGAAIELEAMVNGERSLQTGIKVVIKPPAGDEQEHVVWLAVFENDLDSEVTDGENEGAHLQHDYVVRKLYGPYPVDGSSTRVTETIRLGQDWKLSDLGLAAFVQQSGGSEVVQAVSMRIGFQPLGTE